MPMLTAAHNVELPLLLTKLGKQQRRQHVETLSSRLLADRAKHYPGMSGGQHAACGHRARIVSDPSYCSATSRPATRTAHGR